MVAVLILEYHDALTTESEIFLSLIMKFLDPDKPSWQNGSALEVIHKIMVRPKLLKFICTHFDMNEHSTHVFRDMINGKYNQTFFVIFLKKGKFDKMFLKS